MEGVLYVTPGESLRITVGSRSPDGSVPLPECGYLSAEAGGLSGIARLDLNDNYYFVAVVGGGSSGDAWGNNQGQAGQEIPWQARSTGSCGEPRFQDTYWMGSAGGGWPGGIGIMSGGTSCAPGLENSTIQSISGSGTSPPNTGSLYYIPSAGRAPAFPWTGPISGTGLVMITWNEPIGSRSQTPSQPPSPTRPSSWSITRTSTLSGTAGTTRSFTATASVSPYCNPSVYRSFPNRNVDGLDAAAPALVASERDCQRACCDIPTCQVYTFDRNTMVLGGSFAPCYFLANITQLVPNPGYVSGVKYANNS